MDQYTFEAETREKHHEGSKETVLRQLDKQRLQLSGESDKDQ